MVHDVIQIIGLHDEHDVDVMGPHQLYHHQIKGHGSKKSTYSSYHGVIRN